MKFFFKFCSLPFSPRSFLFLFNVQVYYICSSFTFLEWVEASNALAFQKLGGAPFPADGGCLHLTIHDVRSVVCVQGPLSCNPCQNSRWLGDCPPTVSLAVISHFWARCLSVNPSEKCAAHQRPCCGTSRKAFEHLYRGFSFSSHHSVLSDDCPRCVATLPCSNLALWSLAHQGEHLSLPLCAREASVSFLPSPFSSFPPALLLWWTLTASKLLTVTQSWLLPKWQLGTIIPKLGTSPAVDTEIYRCNRNHLQLSQCFPN